jgi:hypothetical protein
MKKTMLFACVLASSFAQAQGLDSIVVEKYYVSNLEDSLNADLNGATSPLRIGSVTYRVFADLADGYKFIQMFGNSAHDLKISTTTDFYNDPNNGSVFPQNTSVVNTRKNTTLIDSWLAVGGAASGEMGVLKTEDTDGSIGNAHGILINADASIGLPINGTGAQDGLMPGTPVIPNALGLGTATDIFDQTPGDSLVVNGGAIAALGGVQGVTPSNMVLIGQFTTDGVLHFELNIQIGTPVVGGSETYVASNPTAPELSIPSLIYTSPVTSNVGINENTLTKANVSIFPNPAKNTFNIIVLGLNEQSAADSCKIQDIKGALLSKSSLTVANGKISQKVDISSLPSGIYFVTISVAGKNSTHKIIKE